MQARNSILFLFSLIIDKVEHYFPLCIGFFNTFVIVFLNNLMILSVLYNEDINPLSHVMHIYLLIFISSIWIFIGYTDIFVLCCQVCQISLWISSSDEACSSSFLDYLNALI